LITTDPRAVVQTTLSAWDAFVACASEVDPQAAIRKRSAGAAIAEMGTWPGSRTLNDMRADARAGRTGLASAAPPRIPSNPTSDQLMQALLRSRDSLADWVDSVPGWQEESLLLTPTILGPLPLLTAIHGVAYPLALVALDLQAAGVTAPPDLLDAGLNALVDTTGALAARAQVTASITARVPARQFGAGATGGDWCTRDLGSASPTDAGPAVIGDVPTVLTATAGRADVVGLYRSGALRFHDLPGLLHWVPVVESVPGLPGGRTLGRAGRYLGAVTSLWSKLPLTR
jgi:hypothetical protein